MAGLKPNECFCLNLLMLFNENFWEIRFTDFIPIITVFLSSLLIYYIYNKLNNKKELKRVKSVFIRFKIIMTSLITENKKEMNLIGIGLSSIPQEILNKIGIILLDAKVNIDKSKFDNIYKNPSVNFNITKTMSIMTIVDKYLIINGKIENLITNQDIESNTENIKAILLDMINHAKEFYGIKIKEELASF